MSRSRTRVPRWAPTFKEGVRLALRPLIAYFVFTVGGMLALFGTILAYEHNSSKDQRVIVTAILAGIFGIVSGQLIAVLRARSLPLIVVGGMVLGFGIWIIASSGGNMGEEVGVPLLFFSFAFPCGLLSMQHRWELFASFWPAVGWIGAAFAIMNKEGRIGAWNEDKMKIWLPLPLAFLGAFLILWLFYLASKQAMRVELWQTLSGAAARRVAKKARDKKVGALPRKNILALLALGAVLFVITAVLAPYLFRTGKGGKDSGKNGEVKEDPKLPKPPKIDGEALAEQLKKMAQSAEDAAVHLWPLLFLIVLYRPAKRALLKTHLLTPVVPTPPTERIENLWEYVRIAAEDAGVVPAPSDSVEQLLQRIQDQKLGGAGLAAAAQIYARTRYGFTVGAGDALAMRPRAVEAAKELRVNVSGMRRIMNWWRPLS